jgi:hypothetical protein
MTWEDERRSRSAGATAVATAWRAAGDSPFQVKDTAWPPE